MKNSILSVAFAVILVFATSCASIVSKSSYPISINSSPSEASITITDVHGVEVYKGNTPATVSLKSGAGFFKKASYHVKFSKPGFDDKIVPINFKLDGWYIGNIVFGGLIGILIVDPATGAMFKLDTEFLNETLTRTQATTSIEKESLNILTMNNIPESWKGHLVSVE